MDVQPTFYFSRVSILYYGLQKWFTVQSTQSKMVYTTTITKTRLLYMCSTLGKRPSTILKHYSSRSAEKICYDT